MPGTTQKYEFDTNGNRTELKVLTQKENEIETEITSYTYDKNDRLQTETVKSETDKITNYTYDANGNMTQKAGDKAATQHFDLLNRMTLYQSGDDEAEYTYNPDNMRASKTVGDVTTQQIWLGDEIALDITGDEVVSYIHGNKLIQSDYGYYLYNAHGDVTGLVDAESIKRFNYDPYGNQITADESENPYRYCGEYTDFETG